MKRASLIGLRVLGLVLLVAVVSQLGCKSKKEPPIQPDFTDDTTSQDTEDARDTGSGGEGLPDVDIERMLFHPDDGLKTIYFDYDSSRLRSDAIDALEHNAELLEQAPNAMIQIEGHCDERGTQEYNLALGERRALAVREYLMRLGISGDRLITISYGEEQPAALGSNESAWAENRRVEFSRALP